MKVLLGYFLIIFYPIILTGQIQFGNPKIIDNTTGFKKSIYSIDIDSDGDLDVLSIISKNKIAWFANTSNNGIFSSSRIITDTGKDFKSIYPSDLDSDGDIDVLVADNDFSAENYIIAWYENSDGNGNFASRQVISSSINYAQKVFASDLDGDSDMDVISASFWDGKIAWYKNIDGNGNFDNQQIIATTPMKQATSVYASDIDGDGHLDVISSAYHLNQVTWYKNLNNNGFGLPNVISSFSIDERAECVYAKDFDNDGDLDILSGSHEPFKIALFKNIDGLGSFSPSKIISTVSHFVLPVDIDSDKDLDILTINVNNIILLKNINKAEEFKSQIIIERQSATSDIFAGDLDNDDDLDLLLCSVDEICWYENLTDPTSIQYIQTGLLSDFQLKQNYPNPFNPSTTIKYNLHKSSNVKLKIYNFSGQEIVALVNEFQSSGEHEITWQPKGIPSGIYFCKLHAGELSETKKIILQK
jgi:hypothetical protein